MHNPRLLRPALGTIAAAIVLVVGAPASSAQEAPKVRLETLSFPKGGASTIELLVGPEKTLDVKLQSHALTQPILVPRLAKWIFGASETDAEGNFKFTPYAEVAPRSAVKQLLIFIRKGNEAKDGFNIIALDAGNTGFGESQMMVMNLARRNVAGLVGGKKFLLPPAKHSIFKPSADRGEGLCFAALRYEREPDEWRTFMSTNWPILKDARGFVFVYEDPRSKSLKYHTVVDSLLEIKDPEEE